MAGMPKLAVAQTIEELFQQGNAAQEAENYSQAEAIYRRIIQLEPNNAKAYYKLCYVLKDQNKLDDAVAACQKSITLNTNDAQTYFVLGNVLRDQKQLEEALKSYRRAIELDPKSAYAYNGVGNVLRDQKQLEEALKSYRRAIELDPKFASPHAGVGSVLRDQKQLEEALKSYRRAIELDPKFAYAYYGVGSVLYDQKQLEEALKSYRRAIELDPKLAYAYLGVGNVLRDQKKLEEALISYRRAIELDPKFASAYNNVGNVLRDQKKLEEALISYRRAIELDPKSASAYGNIGLVLKEQGKLEEAISKYRQALSLPEDKLTTPASAHTLVHNYLGLALQQQGKLEAAIEEYKKSLQIDPNFIYTNNNLQEAERLLTLRRNPQAEVMDDDRQYLPKNEPSVAILRSVVLIIAEFSGSDRLGPEKGTGLVIQRDGNRTLIITNRHVIFDEKTRKQGQNIQVEFFSEPPSGKLRMRRNARVLGMTSADDNLDIAVLEVTGPLPDDIKPLPTSSNAIQRQMAVRAIGHPLRGIPWSIEPGTISSYNSQELQISGTAIQGGNSGGPVINSENQLLGIVVKVDEGLGFAYPMPVIMEKLRELGIK
jgi:superkiller protein 3